MFIPVGIQVAGGGRRQQGYNRIIDTSGKFEAVATEARDMRVPLERIGEDLHRQIAAAFATEGSSGASGKWTQLSPAYGAWKTARSAAPMLVGVRPAQKRTRRSPRTPAQTYLPSGLMRRQLLVPLSDTSTWHVDARRLVYAPLSDIAGFHQTGTPRMPARPPVDLSVTFLHSIDRQFIVWLNELMQHAGLAGPGSGAAAARAA